MIKSAGKTPRAAANFAFKNRDSNMCSGRAGACAGWGRVTLKIAVFSRSFRVDRQTRKDLKTDKFAEDVFDIFEWTSAHKAEVARYGAALIVVVLIVVGVLYYNRTQASAREEALAKALRVDDATTGSNIQPTNLHFDTEGEKDKAKTAAFTDLAAKYGGTQEGAIADLYLASYAVDDGRLDGAEKR